MQRLRESFVTSSRLWQHMSFVALRGSMWTRRDDALIFHACVPVDEQGHPLSLACEGAAAMVPAIRSAGAIFVGHQAAECFGDYLAGSSHVLPTDGAARFTGGVSTLTFMKAITVQHVTPEAAAALAAPAAALARLEGLEAHALAAEARRAA